MTAYKANYPIINHQDLHCYPYHLDLIIPSSSFPPVALKPAKDVGAL